MTLTNHALTGAVIGLSVSSPIAALFAAFLSHYVLDALPHFGMPESFLKTKAFRNLLITDIFLCILLVGWLFVAIPSSWFLVSICAFLATSPDLFWVNKYIKSKKNKDWKASWYSKFASKIQWFERPSGAFFEMLWAVAFIYIVFTLVQN